MVKVKICGITNIEDAVKAYEFGADFLGFVFVQGAARFAGGIKDEIRNLSQKLKDKIAKVGIFKDEAEDIIEEIISGCDLEYVQLHGDETPEYCRRLKGKSKKTGHRESLKIIKAFKVGEDLILPKLYNLADYEAADYFVFDTFHPKLSGGSGIKFDWKVLGRYVGHITRPFFISGGLTPSNVEEAVRTIHPYGVDVSSGIEKSVGKKDHRLLKEFIENAKGIQDPR